MMRLAAIAFALAASVGPTARAADRPNLLWISCEDISPNLGCYGDRYARTPHLDRLASEGVRFTRAFTPAGVCAVVRSGLITGMYPVAIGSQHMRSRIVPPSYVRCFTEYLRAAGYFTTNRSKTDYQFDPPTTAWDRQGGRHGDWRERAPGQPFFSVVNLTVSHESQIRHGEKRHAAILRNIGDLVHDPEAAAEHLPRYLPDTPEARKNWAWYHDNISEMDRQAGEVLARLEADGLADDTIVVFWGDHGQGMPRGKRWIYDSGTHIPLIVRWPGQLEPGRVREDLTSILDLPPTMLSVAGVDVPDHFHGRVLFGESRQPEPSYLYFHRDRMDEAYELMRSIRDRRFRYVRNYEPAKVYAQGIDYMDLMPATREWRRLHEAGALDPAQRTWFTHPKPIEELYDTESDPDEVENLAARPEHRERLERMRTELEAWQVRIGDLGMVPEPVLMERLRPGARIETAQPPEISVRPLAGPDEVEVSLSCSTPGASLAWRDGDTGPWRLYSQPVRVPSGSTVTTKACRIGFRDSPVVRRKI